MLAITLAAGGSAAPALGLGTPGTFEAFWLEFGAPEAKLGEMARGVDGSMWFIESGAVLSSVASIGRLNSSGALVGEYTIPTGNQPTLPEQSKPVAIALGPDGNMWFTDDGYNAKGENFIGRITPSGRITEFPIPNLIGNYTNPQGIAQGPDGDMWFTEAGADVIGKIGPDGVMLGEFPAPEGRLGAITRGAEGNMWFIDGGYQTQYETYWGRIVRMTTTGDISEFPIPRNKDTPVDALTPEPAGIAIGPDGSIWFGVIIRNEYFHEERDLLGRISSSGEVSELVVPTISHAFTGIVAGSDGNMWFLEPDAMAIDRVTPSGLTKFSYELISEGYPGSLVLSGDGNLWLTVFPSWETGGSSFGILRFVVPQVPVATERPEIAGRAVVGETLITTTGSWANQPADVSYQWQLCDSSGEACVNLGGEVTTSHVLADNEAGHTLRTVVTAAGPGGSASAVSDTSAVVAPRTSSLPGLLPKSPPVGHPQLSRVTATWRFDSSRRYTLLRSLVLRGLPTRSVLLVRCRGRGCPFTQKRKVVLAGKLPCAAGTCARRHVGGSPDEIVLTKWFRGWRLGVGTRISVSVTKAGWIGKEFLFQTRASRSPDVRIACVSSDFKEVGSTC